MDIAAITGNVDTSANSGSARKSLVQDFDTFLTILTAQLQHQDPLEPTDSSEFTKQLVAFAGVEQQIAANEKLEALSTEIKQTRSSNAVNFLGRQAVVPGTKADWYGADHSIKWQYGFAPSTDYDPPKFARLDVYSSHGNKVLSFVERIQPGINKFDWNGISSDGNALIPGEYSLSVTASDQNGNPVVYQDEDGQTFDIDPSIFVQDEVTSIDVTRGEPLITVGQNQISESEILQFIADREP